MLTIASVPSTVAIAHERLTQIIARLHLHFPSIDRTIAHTLGDYPEDLVCAAYQHLMRHHRSPAAPTAADFVHFMEPEMSRRRRLHRQEAFA